MALAMAITARFHTEILLITTIPFSKKVLIPRSLMKPENVSMLDVLVTITSIQSTYSTMMERLELLDKTVMLYMEQTHLFLPRRFTLI